MDKIVYFVAVNDNDSFAILLDGRPGSVKLPDSEVARFKKETVLVKVDGGFCAPVLDGRLIKFSNFKFEKTGQNGVGHYSADSWNWSEK